MPAEQLVACALNWRRCFFNSTLQCLLGTDALRTHMLAEAEAGEGAVTRALRAWYIQASCHARAIFSICQTPLSR